MASSGGDSGRCNQCLLAARSKEGPRSDWERHRRRSRNSVGACMSSGSWQAQMAKLPSHNHYLGAAVHQWALGRLTRSGWAREFYNGKITAKKPPSRAANPRQSMTRDPLALPDQRCPLRRSRARRQPQLSSRTRHLTARLSKGVSLRFPVRIPGRTSSTPTARRARFRPVRSVVADEVTDRTVLDADHRVVVGGCRRR
jgi:hypothetical protein